MANKDRYIEKIKLSDLACERIREMIVKKELKPNERIVETQIAKMLGISQAPVREALKELDVMGLVEIVPYKGCYVVPMSKNRLLQIYSLRAMLEGFAAKQSTGNLDSHVISKMEYYYEKMYEAAKDKDEVALVWHDAAFHREIVMASGNKMLERMWNLIGIPQWSSITVSVNKDSNYDYVAGTHAKILELVKSQDTDGLAKELEFHFTRAASVIIDGIGDEKEE